MSKTKNLIFYSLSACQLHLLQSVRDLNTFEMLSCAQDYRTYIYVCISEGILYASLLVYIVGMMQKYLQFQLHNDDIITQGGFGSPVKIYDHSACVISAYKTQKKKKKKKRHVKSL